MTVTDAGLESTFVHAVVSEVLPENLDMLGECLNCTWVHREKVYHHHRCSPGY